MKKYEKIDVSGNIGVTSSIEISNICEPLYSLFEITYFNYVKLNSDGSRSILTDRPDFIVEYYNSSELLATKAISTMENSNKTTSRLSSEFRDQPSFIVARNQFNIDNGLTIIQPTNDGKELYYFGTTRENYDKTYFYVSNIDMFYRFIAYFKDKAESLIKKADAERFLLLLRESEEETLIDLEKIRNKFIEATSISRYFINQNLDTFLTKREAECLYYLSKADSAKKIGKILNLSPRTVETYLMKVKEKLNCKTKKELINTLINSDLGRILSYSFTEKDGDPSCPSGKPACLINY